MAPADLPEPRQLRPGDLQRGPVADLGGRDGLTLLALGQSRIAHEDDGHLRGLGLAGDPVDVIGVGGGEQEARLVVDGRRSRNRGGKPFQIGAVVVGDAIVIAHQGEGVRGEGPYDVHGFVILAQGQGSRCIFDEHHALPGRPAGRGGVLRTGYRRERDVVVGIVRVVAEDAEFIARDKQGQERLVEVFLGQIAQPKGLAEGAHRLAAFQVEAAFEGQGGALRFRSRDVMAGPDIGHGAAVGHDVAAEAPFPAQDVLQEQAAAGSALAVHAVVGPHHGFHPRVFDKHPESGQVGFAEIAGRGRDVKRMPQPFRPGMHGIVLGAGRRLQIKRIISLHAAHEGTAERAGQERVLSVGLHSSSPAGVPENIDIGRPIRQAGILAEIAIRGG